DGSQPSVQRPQADAAAAQEALSGVLEAVGGALLISCGAFRSRLQPGSSDAEVLEHLRRCDACLEHALRVDPDNFYRAIGGESMEPPGGVDAFASSVMSEIRLRQTERVVPHRMLAAPRRLVAAAAILFAAMTTLLVYNRAPRTSPAPAATPTIRTAQLAT